MAQVNKDPNIAFPIYWLMGDATGRCYRLVGAFDVIWP
jgi:hypothetical protein